MPDHSQTAALITGGTQGLGLAIAERLAAEGCRRIALAGRGADRGAAAVSALRAQGVDALFLPADLGQVDQATGVVEAAAAQFGRLTALVNSAAATDRGSILDTTPERFDHIFAVNTRGAFFALQRFAQLAIAGNHAAQAVNILSMVVHGGQTFLAPYSASRRHWRISPRTRPIPCAITGSG